MATSVAPATRPVTITHWQRDPEEDYTLQRPLDLGMLWRVYDCTRQFAGTRNALLVTTVIRSVQLPLLAWALGAIINGPISARDFWGTVWWSFGYLLLALSTQFVFHFRQRLALEFGEEVAHSLRMQIFEHLQRLPMSFYNKTKLGRIISRMTSDVESVRVGVQDVLFVSTVSMGQMLVALLLMLWTDVWLTALLASMAPVLWGIQRYFRSRLSQAYRQVQESFSRLTSTLAESVNGIRVTQGFVRQQVNSQVFEQLAVSHAGTNRRAAKLAGTLFPMLEFNSQLFIAILLLVGGYRVLQPELHMDVGSLIQFFFLANVFFQPIQILGNQYNQALTSMAGAERVFKLLDVKPSWEDPTDAVDLPRLRGRVEFEDVTFGYDPRRPVLHQLNFTVEPGQTVALVGHTGSGKSSIINLVSKFYLPTSGRILLDGHDLLTSRTASLHRQLGIVLQQNFLFGGTVLENIRTGRAEASDDEVMRVTDHLGCRDLFESLPQGFQTEVGERGSALSLGQRQLVCFARALLADPAILILDEATSSVDTLTEVRIQKALTTLLAGRTAFVIAHRLSTIRDANLILVLDQGQIIERGTHAQLLARDGTYAHLYEQFVQAGAAN